METLIPPSDLLGDSIVAFLQTYTPPDDDLDHTMTYYRLGSGRRVFIHDDECIYPAGRFSAAATEVTASDFPRLQLALGQRITKIVVATNAGYLTDGRPIFVLENRHGVYDIAGAPHGVDATGIRIMELAEMADWELKTLAE